MGGLGEDAFSPSLQPSPSAVSSVTAVASTKGNPFAETPADPASCGHSSSSSSSSSPECRRVIAEEAAKGDDDANSLVHHEPVGLSPAAKERGTDSWYIREGSRFTEAIRAGGRRKR